MKQQTRKVSSANLIPCLTNVGTMFNRRADETFDL